jgi:Fur family iron response transcriptional regulator
MRAAKLACISPQEIESKLESAGILPTAQRIAVCRYVLCEADHPTAEQVKEWADRNFPKISLATVYNTLGTLVAAGLLKELKLPNEDSVMYDGVTEAHHHFLDEKTGEVFDIPADAIQIDAKLGKGFQVSGMELLIRGTRK